MNKYEDNNMGEEFAEEEDVIVMVDEEGKEQEFYDVAELELNGKTYIYLEPVEKIEGFEDGDLLIYEISTDEKGEEVFLPLETEAEIQAAFDEFLRVVAEEEKNGDDED